MIKILVAPTAFKGSFSPADAAEALAKGFENISGAQVILVPMADGGDGTVEALHTAIGGTLGQSHVQGATGLGATAHWLLQPGKFAVAELASACGIASLPKLEPLHAHTYGLGQVIHDCLDSGVPQVFVAVGGSASTDGGSGALQALGARFFDTAGKQLPLGGVELSRLHRCDLSELQQIKATTKFTVLTDVTNPLLGKSGAAKVFGPQKGASQDDVSRLEEGLLRLADVLEAECVCHRREHPGAGAAGGTAFGLACALSATITSGFDWIAEATDLVAKIRSCDLIVTGEGSFDSQSLQGKVTGKIIDLCRQHKKPIWVIAGRSDLDAIDGVERIVSLSQNGQMASLDALTEAVRDLKRTKFA